MQRRGITLAQYARVSAARSEEFPLADVLAHEGIDERSWELGEEAWVDAIDDDDDRGGELRDRFDSLFAQARSQLGRPVPPYDEDLGAWLDFVRIWSAHEKPLELLTSLRLRPTDVVRLHVAWSERLRDSPMLQRSALKHLEREPGALRPPAPGTSTLAAVPPEDDALRLPSVVEDEPADDDDDDQPARKPPPFLVALPRPVSSAVTAPAAPVASPTREPPAQPPPPAPTEAEPEVSLLEWAHLRAEMQIFPERAEQILSKYGLAVSTKREEVERYWQQRLQRDPADAADFAAIYTRSVKHWQQQRGT